MQYKVSRTGKYKIHYAKYADVYRRLARARYHEYHRKVLLLLGGPYPCCSCCREKSFEFLTIDHIFGGGKKHRKNTPGGFYDPVTFFKEILNDPEWKRKYRLLCFNCNCARSRFGYCPHQIVKLKRRKLE